MQAPSHTGGGNKPKIIGLYGLPGVGKTHMLNSLRRVLDEAKFAFYEGSTVLEGVADGGLSAFKKFTGVEQEECRQQAINLIARECADSGKTGIIAGHFMFWNESQEAERVWTTGDADKFTHILYLDAPADVIADRIEQDNAGITGNRRDRTPASVPHIRQWRTAEERELRKLCHEHQIFFLLVDPNQTSKIQDLLNDFHKHNEAQNLINAKDELDRIVAEAGGAKLETMLVLDADRTLAAEDAGELFWKSRTSGGDDPIKALFKSARAYSYAAFRQAVLQYEEIGDNRFDGLCEDVAKEVHLRPDFKHLLQSAADLEHVGAVVVTCGIRRVWEMVLEREGLFGVQVIGAGRIANKFVVTGAVKGALVARMQHKHHLFVWAFGDSPLDLGMLTEADQSIVVVGETAKRSKAMDAALRDAIDIYGLRARQMLLPSTVPPRLDHTRLPEVMLDDDLKKAVLSRRLHFFHATDKPAAKVLMTATRDAANAGPSLRKAHHRVGFYLATEYLTSPAVIGTEEYEISHVQGNTTAGHRLLHEQDTVIVPLMRGGEPMAFGVNDAFPLASFVHVRQASTDLKAEHLKCQSTVVLVDSVVNTGTSIVEFVEHIRKLDKTIRIVVVAGVVQKNAVAAGGKLARAVAAHGGEFRLVALRFSENSYTGKGSTDTGHRLFNTTRLD